MVKGTTRLIDRVLAATLAVIMVLAMLPVSTFTAYALPYADGNDCPVENCGGKLRWRENPESDGKHYLICNNTACASSAIDQAYAVHDQGAGEADCELCNPPHEHGAFTYSLEGEGKTIAATCGGTGNCDLDGNKVAITITAPADLAYNGKVKAATISGANTWKSVTGNDAPEIVYNAEPKTVGAYTASITVAEVTASVEFTIVKGTPDFTAPEGLTAEYGQSLADVVLPDGFAWEDETVKFEAVGEQSFEATYTPLDTDNYNVVEDVDVKVAVGKASRSIDAPTMLEKSITSITLNAVTTESGGEIVYGYALENNADKVEIWQPGTVFGNLEGSTDYYFFARVEATENYEAATSGGNAISTANKMEGDVTISIEGWTYGDKDIKGPEYEVVKGAYTDIIVEWSLQGSKEWTPWEKEAPTQAGQYTVRVVCSATPEWNIKTVEQPFEIKQKEVAIKWGNTEFVYNAQNQKPTAMINTIVVAGDDISVQVTGEQKVVGTEYSASAKLIGKDADNYVIKENGSTRFAITTKEITITWSNTDLVHTEKKQKPTADINGTFEGDDVGVEVTSEGDEVDVDVTSEGVKSPGAYTATAALTGADKDNYHIQADLVNCKFTISNHETPEEPYTIVKADAEGKPTADIAEANQHHWYNYDICIVPKENYEIAVHDNTEIDFVAGLSDSDFGPYLFVDSSKENYTFYLRCTDSNCAECGGYTGAIVVGDPDVGNVKKGMLNIDKNDPTVSVKLNAANEWTTILDVAFFDMADRFFNKEQTVTISGTDDNSGIEQIYYYTIQKNRLTQDDLLDAETIQGDDVVWTEGDSVTVNANNDYVIYAKIVDNAGNVTYASSNGIVYDVTTPVINVSYSNNDVKNEKYFNADRTIEIKVTEHNFDAEKFVLSVKEGGVETGANYTLNWTPSQDNEDEYTAFVTFTNEADYEIGISCDDKAGNPASVTYGESKAPTEFTIDKAAPTATLTINGFVKDLNGDGEDEPWTEKYTEKDGVRTSIDYNRWSWRTVKVAVSSEDTLSDLDYIEYFKSENIVNNITDDTIEWTNTPSDSNPAKDVVEFEVAPNEKFIVYVHVVDKAGNDIYLSSNGVIVDNTDPKVETVAPQITVTPSQQPVNGIYNTNVNVDVSVTEIEKNDAFSGLKNIRYEVYNRSKSETEPTQTGVLYSFNYVKNDKEHYLEIIDSNNPNGTEIREGYTPNNDDLRLSWTRNAAIVVNAEDNNSNDVIVKVIAEDNAGNTNEMQIALKIDVTNPTIDVSYDNNTADSDKYFKAKREATIKVTERNFDEKDFSFVFMKDGEPVEIKGENLEWTHTNGSGNRDDATHKATYTFAADADYLLGGTGEVKKNDKGEVIAPYFLYTDEADNSFYYYVENEVEGEGKYTQVDFHGTAPTDFTVDKIAPVVSVSYDNNSAENEKYFKDFRTVTVRIVEHNFPTKDMDRVVFTQTADRGGEIPKVSWTHKGDIHIATFEYDTDGDYTFDVSVTDLAGNKSKAAKYGDSVAGKDFIIDTTYEDMIAQSGVENGVAYGYDADVIPSIEISDINLQNYTVTLTGVQKDKTIDLTDEVNALLEKGVETVTGIFDIFENKQDLDGIYTLKMTSKDKAGNEDSMEIVFTVNRYGSVYVYEDYLLNLIKDGGTFVQAVTNDLVITEYNADKLVADALKIEITVDGRPLDNVQFDVTPEINDKVSVGSSGWYQYKYTISKDNFAADGVYKISVSSEDATGNTPENSNYEDMGISFRVDSTKAEISSVVGLEKAIINAQEVTVKYIVFDTIGIKSIMVYVDGKPVNEITDFTADPNNYSGSFTLTEKNSAQAVQIVVEDMAGNITDTNAEDFAPAYEFNGSVTVSTNIFVRWYADKGLFWGSIGGVIAVAGALWFFLASKKKKAAAK